MSSQDQPPQPGHDDDGDDGDKDIYPTTYRVKDLADVRELADAERAVARHGATHEQAEGVDEAGRVRRAEQRLAAWQERKSGRTPPVSVPLTPPSTA